MKPFLPFARPDIDEDSIAAVAAVLRSGQLASGPKVLTLEAELAAYIGGANPLVGALRVTFWSALAMIMTAAVGATFGTHV